MSVMSLGLCLIISRATELRFMADSSRVRDKSRLVVAVGGLAWGRDSCLYRKRGLFKV